MHEKHSGHSGTYTSNEKNGIKNRISMKKVEQGHQDRP